MSWTYSGDPTASTRDQVRFLIGDTDTDDQQLTDAEVDYALAETSDEPYSAAIICAEALRSKYARKMDKSIGDLSASFSQLVDHYSKLIQQLRRRAITLR